MNSGRCDVNKGYFVPAQRLCALCVEVGRELICGDGAGRSVGVTRKDSWSWRLEHDLALACRHSDARWACELGGRSHCFSIGVRSLGLWGARAEGGRLVVVVGR